MFAEFCNKVVQGNELMLAEVAEVDRDERSCTVVDDGVEYYGVRLQPVVERQSGVVLFPRKGAMALVAKIEGGDLCVVSASEYDMVDIKISDTSLTMDENGIIANGGGNSGLVKIDKLIEWMDRVHSDLTNLKTKLFTHPVAGNNIALGLDMNVSVLKPKKSDFEDTKFKH